MVLKRLKHSIAFRIFPLYKFLLLFLRIAPAKQKNNKNLTVVMLCGRSQIQMLQESIYSIIKSFEECPLIFVFADKDMDRDYCQEQLKWLKCPITIIESAECISYHRKSGNKVLAEFASKNPMGLKMAAILQVVAERDQPVLYSDTDVLWFKDPTRIFSELILDEDTTIALSEDFQSSYDYNLIERAELTILLNKPYYCAGILFLKSLSTVDKNHLEYLLEIAVQHSNHFTEQTIFSYLNKLRGNKSLNSKQFVINLDDQFRITPSIDSHAFARHYVGPVRHQFWRDALAYRFH